MKFRISYFIDGKKVRSNSGLITESVKNVAEMFCRVNSSYCEASIYTGLGIVEFSNILCCCKYKIDSNNNIKL